jgi:hypothetical protein
VIDSVINAILVNPNVKKFSRFLVPILCMGMNYRRLCLHFFSFPYSVWE